MATVDLGKQVGPLPIGAWIVVVGVGIGIAVYTRRMGEAGTDGDLEDLSVPTGVGEGTGSYLPALEDEPDVEVEFEPGTNEEWITFAARKLIQQTPAYDPIKVINALTRYVTGKPLSGPDWTYVVAAIRVAGPPPFPVLGRPRPRPDNRPPGPRKHTTRPGDTMGSVSRRYYRTNTEWPRIYRANRRGVARPGMRPGWLLPRHNRRTATLPPGRQLLIPPDS